MADAALEGQTVLVTGGANRIGRAVATALADAGCRVVVHARSSMEEAQALATELGGVALSADLGDPEQAEGLVAASRDALGARIDHVVNNASHFARRTLADARYEDLDAMMRLHAWAPLAIARAAASQGASSVINLLDTRVTSRDPQHMPYLLSKQALAQLTRTLAWELAPTRVNGIAPGPILPPNEGDGDPPKGDAGTAADGPPKGDPERRDIDASLQAAIDATRLGRLGAPEEIAHAVRFLLEADYVTGEIIHVDGGRHLRDS